MLKYSNNELITSESMINMEVTEEKLYRLLSYASEKNINFSDSEKIMTIPYNQDLSIII